MLPGRALELLRVLSRFKELSVDELISIMSTLDKTSSKTIQYDLVSLSMRGLIVLSRDKIILTSRGEEILRKELRERVSKLPALSS